SRAAAARRTRRARRRAADRDHQGCRPPVAVRPRRLALPQPPFLSGRADEPPGLFWAAPTSGAWTLRTSRIPGAAATPQRGCCETTVPEPPPCTFTSSFSAASLARARDTLSPTRRGTTPCWAFGRTSVTWSHEDSV